MRVSIPMAVLGALLAGCGVVHASAFSAGSVRSDTAPGCEGVAVGPAREAVSVAERGRWGLDVWPDTALGVLPDGSGRYRFLSTGTPGSQGTQHVIVTGGTLDDPAAGGVLSSRPVSNVPSDYDYAGGGPVYRDPQSGLVLQMLHLERPYGDDPSRFYTELHLGRVDPATGDVVRLGPIVRPDIDFTTVQKATTPTTIDLGTPSFSVTDIGGITYLYVYFADASGDSAHVSFSGLSVARAPLDEVLAAAGRGTVSTWSKYDGGQWSQPALGGTSTDLNANRPMAWAPNTARGAGRTVMVAGESPHDMVLSTSADGVTGWSARHPLWRDPDMFDAYPTIVGDGTPNAPGDTFSVYYTQWQSTSPVWSTARLMRRTVRCTQGMTATDIPLVRYSNGTRHQVTTGPASAGYHEEGRWYLRSAQEPGTVALYGCRNGRDDQFLYTNADCGGFAILQTEGWIYTTPPQDPSVPLYRCHIAGIGDHFVSTRPDCEAPGNPNVAQEGLLGYAKTSPH
jgi:hypothetical protein